MVQYIDEIKLRLIRLMVVMEMNDSEFVMYVNQARQDVQRLTLHSHRERYGKICQLSVGTIDQIYSIRRPYTAPQIPLVAFQLPVDLIEIFAVQYSEGELLTTEARRYDLRELYNVGMHSWNYPTRYRPVYTIIDNYPLYAPLSTMLFSAGQDTQADADITIWYTAAVQGLDLYDAGFNYGVDNDITIPMELEELVILYAMRSVMQRIEAPSALQSIIQAIALHEQAIQSGYKVEQLKISSLLPSQGEV